MTGFVKAEMYYLTKFTNEAELRAAVDAYIRFYNYERFQNHFGTKTPMEVCSAALPMKNPSQSPIAGNKKILSYEAKFAA